MTEGIFDLAVAHAPELIFQRDDDGCPRLERLLPGRVGIGDIQMQDATSAAQA